MLNDNSRIFENKLRGSDNQESPSVGSAHSSISPPISLMHDITAATSPTITGQQTITTTTIPVTLSQICPPTAAPLGSHQILIDPTTGQHFLVSSAPPAPHPQIIYQPVYYSATPAQPVYYHPFTSGAHGAYVVAATPITASQAGNQIAPSHMALGQRFSSTPPLATTAQSTTGCYVHNVADFDDTRSTLTTDERHTVLEHPTMSTIRSRAVDAKQILVSKNSISPPHASPVLSQNCLIFDNLATTPLGNSQNTPTQMRPQEATTYQEVVSKPVISTSTVTISHVKGHQTKNGERTPLFGAAPAWWGENGTSSVKVRNDDENTRLNVLASANSTITTVADSNQFVLSHTEVMKSNCLQHEGDTTTGNAHRPLKSIRMDIDLNEPFVDEEAKKENKAKAAQRTLPSTAFTVSFDSEEDSQKVNLSLQDAAKKTSSRRFMRSMPASGLVSKGTAAKIAGLTAASSDPKQYLLNKMLMGIGEDGDHANQMVTSQTVKDSDAESVSSESTTTQSTENLRPTMPIRMGSTLPQINENVSNTGGETENNKHLLSDLLHLNSGRVAQRCIIGEHQIVAPSTPPLSNSSRLTAATGTHVRTPRRPNTAKVEERQYNSHRLCTIASSSRSALSSQVHRTQPIAGASGMNDNTFRRGDGGRYSMRFSGISNKNHPTSAAISRNDRPPFRVGGSGRNQASGIKAQKESAEMTAWLRRKDYNPMKAAAEAKKLQQLKARADKFASNRSISFHQGTRPFTNVPPIVRNSNKARHNRSQDDLSVNNASCGPETILVNYSKGITRDLNKLRSSEASQDQ
ncbi:hypothetical protein WUBG_03753, partial [Wuchereria bancrofti]